MEVVERQLKLAQVQAEDLIEQRRTLHERVDDDAKRTPHYHREQQKWQAMRAVTRERNRLVLFSVNELNEKIDACIARMNPPPVEEVPIIYEEEEDKHATLNKLAIARMFKTTMAHGSAMDVLTALEDLNQRLKIAAGATD